MLRLEPVDGNAGFDEVAVDVGGGSRGLDVAVEANVQSVVFECHRVDGAVVADEDGRAAVVGGGDEKLRRPLGAKLVERALDDDATVVDDRDRVAGPFDLCKEVRRDDDRPSL